MAEVEPRRKPSDFVPLWTPEECAEALRMAPGTLRNLRAKKSGPPCVRLGGRIWYRPEGVVAWLAAREK